MEWSVVDGAGGITMGRGSGGGVGSLLGLIGGWRIYVGILCGLFFAVFFHLFSGGCFRRTFRVVCFPRGSQNMLISLFSGSKHKNIETCLSMGTGSAFILQILEACHHAYSIHNPYILPACSLHESCLVPQIFLQFFRRCSYCFFTVFLEFS